MPTYVDSDYGPIDIDEGKAHNVSGSPAIFNPAIKAMDLTTGNPVIVLVMDRGLLMCVETDGKLVFRNPSDVQLDWRYNFKTEEWTDASGTTLETTEGA